MAARLERAFKWGLFQESHGSAVFGNVCNHMEQIFQTSRLRVRAPQGAPLEFKPRAIWMKSPSLMVIFFTPKSLIIYVTINRSRENKEQKWKTRLQ
ncbi:MAG: hypothetical protein JJE18_04450 [Eubacteriaceae bacterium]|nr:hypothetical protein [Eubacteriaceae bacterium]